MSVRLRHQGACRVSEQGTATAMWKVSALFLLLAMPCLASVDLAPATEYRLFDLLKARLMAASGIPASAATSAQPPNPSLPQNDPTEIKRQFAEAERVRQSAFDKEFGEGAFADTVTLSRECLSSNACSKLAFAGLIEAAYHFVALETDVESGLSPRSSAYKARRMNILNDMKPFVEKLRPGRGIRAGDAAARLRVLGPIAKRIFSKRELLDFAQRCASDSDSAAAYDYLGQILSESGAAEDAHGAFEAALKRKEKGKGDGG